MSRAVSLLASVLFFFERERKAGTALLSFGDVVGETLEVGEPLNTKESPPCAGGEKGLSLRAIREHFGWLTNHVT